MGKRESGKKKESIGKWVSKGLKKIISLTLGDSDFGPATHKRGDLLFNEDCMEILDINFDENKIPRPKVFKLNLQVTRFFKRIKNHLRTLNSIYLVYSDDVVMLFDSSGSEWEERFKAILNEEYQLELEKIHFIRESDILNLYNSAGIRERLNHSTDYFKNPYQLKSTEFLIIAGGFINFKYDQSPLIKELKGGITDFKSHETIATIEVEFFKFKNNIQTEKIHLMGDYPIKYRQNSGAYFYIGGEWYHNIFVPEFFDSENSRYICFRIDDDGKYIRFFPDSKNRHIPVCVKKPVKEYGRDFFRLSYSINPEYISKPDIMDIKISIRYESEKGYEVTEIIDEQEEKDETSIETLSWGKINREIKSLEEMEKQEVKESGKEAVSEEKETIDYDALPFFLSEMILLPRPGGQTDEIPAYIMNIGDAENYIKFQASGIENQVSIFSSDLKNKIFKKKIGEKIDFSKILGGHEYSFSNDLLSRINDDEIKLYFAWSLKSTKKEKNFLQSDYYIIGRDPLQTTPGHTIKLNKTKDKFWRIGSSRNHAFLKRGDMGYIIFNISTSNSIYILKPEDLNKTDIQPLKIGSVTGNSNLEQYRAFLSKIQIQCSEKEMSLLPRFSKYHKLENNDLVIIGNRVFLYVLPLVIESQLKGDAKDFLKTVQLKKNIN